MKKEMHEVSLATGMAEELARIACESRAKKVLRVTVRIGRMSGVVKDSLVFAFDAVKLDHPLLASASLCVREIPVSYECIQCGKAFQNDAMFFPCCPLCGSHGLKRISGDEMNVESMEIEEEERKDV